MLSAECLLSACSGESEWLPPLWTPGWVQPPFLSALEGSVPLAVAQDGLGVKFHLCPNRRAAWGQEPWSGMDDRGSQEARLSRGAGQQAAEGAGAPGISS